MRRAYLKSLGEEITVDPDATIIEAHKRAAEWTYQKVKGYQPLLAYVNEVCVHHEFRAGSVTAGTGALRFIKECEKKLPSGKRLYWRSDSAWYQAEVVNHCSQGRRRFSITVDQDSAVKAAQAQISAPLMLRDQISATQAGFKESIADFGPKRMLDTLL